MTLIECIKKARKNKRIPTRFRSADVKRVCLGFALRTYSNFLPKHKKGNTGRQPEYFRKNADGTYSLL